MHKYERIALWSAIVLLLILFIFRPRLSGYSGSAFNLMDAQEFRNVPKDIKALYTSQALKITDLMSGFVARDWNALSTADKNKVKSGITTLVTGAGANINTQNVRRGTCNIFKGPMYDIPQNAGCNATTTTPSSGSETRKSGYEMPNVFDYASGYEIPNVFNMFSAGQPQKMEEDGYTSYFVQ
jgi:hypothetical protein